ncbi:MAG: phage Gp37/Gp68 family protein [Elusimicrobiaceae bacterium]|nr:phage Gp37/Gp68 family protein [Elusimicrobiaceae bacterium]
MAQNSRISWTSATWNPVTGCSKISLGCQNCYAYKMALYLQSIGAAHYQKGFKVALHEDALSIPLKWKSPKLIFANSMSDLFHEKVPLSFLLKIFETIKNTPHHKYQILTKRPERMLELNDKLSWYDNVLMGTTIESAEYLYRLDLLKKCSAKTKFLSLEPLLSNLKNLDLKGIDWVILGGESGENARPMQKEWVLDIKKQCQEQKVPFFFKQWGGRDKNKGGNLLDGQKIQEYPFILRESTLFDLDNLN